MTRIAGAFFLFAAALLGLSACNSGGVTNPVSSADLTGQWFLKKAVVQGTMDVLPDSVTTYDTSLAVDSTNYFLFRPDQTYGFQPPPDPTGGALINVDFGFGNWSVSGNTLTLLDSAIFFKVKYKVSLTNDTLTAACNIDTTLHWSWLGAQVTSKLKVTYTATKQ